MIVRLSKRLLNSVNGISEKVNFTMTRYADTKITIYFIRNIKCVLRIYAYSTENNLFSSSTVTDAFGILHHYKHIFNNSLLYTY